MTSTRHEDFNERLMLSAHRRRMDEERGGPKSDWRAIGLCLLHVGVLFVPVVFCMLLLAGVSLHKSATAAIDPIETGSITQR